MRQMSIIFVIVCLVGGGWSSWGYFPPGASFWPNDPYFAYDAAHPLYPGQWNLVNLAPAFIDFPTTQAPNGKVFGAVTIDNVGLDVNIAPVWRQGFTGEGVIIGVCDDGVQLDHIDLNIRHDLCVDFEANGELVPDGTGGPASDGDMHGTCVAGVAAAVGGNATGICGLAPRAQVASLRCKRMTTLESWFIHPGGYYWQAGLEWTSGMTGTQLAGLTRLVAQPTIAVRNSSTRSVAFNYPDTLGDCYTAAARMGANGGLFTVAAGNNRRTRQQDADLYGETCFPYGICVGALGSKGKYASYSCFGSNLLATMLSQSSYWNGAQIEGDTSYVDGFGVYGTDLYGHAGQNYDSNAASVFLPDLDDYNYTAQFDGTSAAAPSLAGVLAVVRQANPLVGPRLARHLLAETCRVVDATDASGSATWSVGGATWSGWVTNPAGRHFNPNYGFGLPDAGALVTAALHTSLLSAETIYTTGVLIIPADQQTILAHDPAGASRTITVSVPADQHQPLEGVEVWMQITGGDRSQWQVTLQKDGMSSRLWAPANDIPNTGIFMFADSDPEGGLAKLLLSNAFWGMDPDGQWELAVANPTGATPAAWLTWGLILHMGQRVEESPNQALAAEITRSCGVAIHQPTSQLVIATGQELQTSQDVLVQGGILQINGLLVNDPTITCVSFDTQLVNVTQELSVVRGVQLENMATLCGAGTIILPPGADGRGGVVNWSGAVHPGIPEADGPGQLTIGGDDDQQTVFQQMNTGTLEIEIFEAGAAELVVNGTGLLEGNLALHLAEGFTPEQGASYRVMSASQLLLGNVQITCNRPEIWWTTGTDETGSLLVIVQLLVTPLPSSTNSPNPTPTLPSTTTTPSSTPVLGWDTEAFETFITTQLAHYQAPGAAIAAVSGDQVLFLKGFGVRELGRNGIVDENTRFQLASATKFLTALMAGTLVDQGRIGWDTPVRQYLPNWAMHDLYAGEHVTLRDFLAHRSSLPGFGELLGMFGYDDAEILRRVRYIPPKYAFREHGVYSNLGIFVAGEVAVSQDDPYPTPPASEGPYTPWEEALYHRLLEPLAMDRSGTSLKELTLDDNYAGAHKGHPDQIHPTLINQCPLPAAGAAVSTASDMARLMQCLLAGGRFGDRTIVSATALAEIFRPAMVIRASVPPMYEDSCPAYGLGCNVYAYQGHQIVEKNGAIAGMRSLVTLVPDLHIGVTTLANLDQTLFPEAVRACFLEQWLGPPRQPVQDDIWAMQPAMDAQGAGPTPPALVEPPTLPLDVYAGTYRHPVMGAFQLSVQGSNLLVAAVATGATSTLAHWNRDTFTWQFPELDGMLVDFTISQGQIIQFGSSDNGWAVRDGAPVTPMPSVTPSSPDLNGDGVVDSLDLLLMQDRWHTGP